MAVAEECQVAEDFVREDNHTILTCHSCHFTQDVGFPGDTTGVVGIAHDHHRGLFLSHEAFQFLKVHAVEPVGGGEQRIIDADAAIALDDVLEGIIDGLLDNDLITRAGEEIDGQAEACHDAGDKGHLVLGELEAVAFTLPVNDGLPVAVIEAGVAVNRVVAQAVHQGLGNLGAHGKVHVSNPQG